MKCPVCGGTKLNHDTRDQIYTYKGESTVIPAVTGDYCPDCNESIHGAAETNRAMKKMGEFQRQVNALREKKQKTAVKSPPGA